ncbi:hypothetical protein [Plantactinospora sp. WMMB782]|uniref:hypothetical protein n=1 Tax=Plantactinospora sp. WMMB782 TaxID=3404121 RepID=UPI003B92ED73
MELIKADGTLADGIADDSHTREEHRLDPGVYPSKGHVLLVGTNERNLTVIDLGGVIQVGGIDVTDPDHLDALAEYFQRLAVTFRARQTN